MTIPRSKWLLGCVAAGSLLGCGSDEGDGDGSAVAPIELSDAFDRADPAAESPSGHTLVAECSSDGQTWDAAEATIHLYQDESSAMIHLEVTGARPDTLFTAWLRLRGTDPDTGEKFGGSPITDAGSTPLAPSSDLDALVAMAEGPGESSAPNAFTTDADGAGMLHVELDCPVIGGAYPFDRYDPALAAVDIQGAPVAPFMIRLASHCTDALAHGVSQGDREMWFNWSPQ